MVKYNDKYLVRLALLASISIVELSNHKRSIIGYSIVIIPSLLYRADIIGQYRKLRLVVV